MSSFHELGDEFAGDAANEEWDAAWAAYASGVETAHGVLTAPLRAALRLPTGRVELRGEVDDEVVDVLVDLHDDHEPHDDLLGIDERNSLATFVVRRDESPDDAAPLTPTTAVDAASAPWWLEHHGTGVVDAGRGWESLTTTLLTRLAQASVAADTGQLHLDAACVELDGLGVVLVGGHPAERDVVLHALLAEGAGYLTRGDLVLQPGTRSVRGTPTPLWNPVAPGDRGPMQQLVPARGLAPVVDHCVVGTIVFLPEGEVPAEGSTPTVASTVSPAAPPGPATALVEIDPAAAVLRLAATRRPEDEPVPEAALDLLAQLVAGATCVELPAVRDERDGSAASIDGGPASTATAVSHEPGPPEGVTRHDGLDRLVASIRGVQAPERRRLVARFHWSAPTEGAAPSGGRRSRRGAVTPPTRRRMVRFDRTAVLWDGAASTLRVVEAEGADRFELEAVDHLDVRPGPDAFALPNCPTGAVARELWSSMSLLEPVTPGRRRGDGQDGDAPRTRPVGADDAAAAPDPDDLPTGVAAELVSRGLLLVDDAQQATAVARHVAGRERTEAAVLVLEEVLDTAAAAQILPVVVGSLVQAFDGPLPEHLTDVDRIDLLVRRDDLDRLSDDLEARGYVAQVRTLSGTSLVTASDRRLEHPDRPGITVDLHRSLAAGPFGELVDPEEFHRRAVPFRIGGRWVPALHPEHRFVHACVRADRGGGREHLVELRDVVLTAPQGPPLLAEAMECSARWGATTSVLAVVRSASARLPGLPTWLVERSRHQDAPPRRRRRRVGRI